MTDKLVIVFVKNILLGKVKTRLAETIGNQAAFEIYKELVEITEHEISFSVADTRVYFSDEIISNKFENSKKYIQEGENLGIRMHNAFKQGFEDGYKKVVLIGSDLPDLKSTHISEAFTKLSVEDFVLGPAADGGYYLIGMRKAHKFPFINKPWSTEKLLNITENEIKTKNYSLNKLEILNDIDTWKDYIRSSIYQEGKYRSIE